MRTLLAVSLLGLAACDSKSSWHGGAIIVIRAEHLGQGAGRRTGAWILENEREWKEFWAERRASATPPAPDFRDMFAVAVVRALGGSDSFGRVQARSTPEALHIVVTAAHGPVPLAVERRDHAVVVVPRTNQPVRLHYGYRSENSWVAEYEAPRSVWKW